MPIIINGGSRSAGGWWSKHLGNTTTNDRAELVEITGLSAETMREAFREMRGVSLGTKCTNYFYQANINPREDEHLTPAQWREAVDILEKNLGLTGQPRFVVEHEKEGRTHRHVVWSRIDPERMTAISDSLTAAIHERTSRQLEIRFDLERGRSVLTRDRDFERPERRPRKHETFRALETGIDPQNVKAEIGALWRSADNGQSFKAALEASGYILARGDRRDFVVIDCASDEHSLARCAGVKAAEVRERMSGIDKASLPSVAEARAQQRSNQAEKEISRSPEIDNQAAPAVEREPPAGQPEPSQNPEPTKTENVRPLGKMAGEIRTAWSLTPDTPDGEQLIEALAARGVSLAEVSLAEARQSERLAAFAKAAGNFSPILREGEIVAVNEHGDVHRINPRTTGDDRATIDGRLAGIDRAALVNVTDAREAMQAAALEAWKAERRAEREQARPASWIENRIAECAEQAARLGATVLEDANGRRVDRVEALGDRLRLDGERQTHTVTVHGREAFAAQLEDAGIALVRVTETDAKALDALRADENLARLAAEANQEAYKGHHFGELLSGELAAVTRNGDVHRINPDKFSDAKRFLDPAADLPGVIETRARFEIEGERQAAVWAQHRTDIADWQLQRDSDRASARFDAVEIKGGVKAAEREVEAAPMETAQAVREGLGILATIGQAFFGLFGSWAMAPPKLTPEQAKQEARAEAEAAPLREAERNDAEERARLNEILDQIKRSDEREQQQARARDDYDRGRERER